MDDTGASESKIRAVESEECAVSVIRSLRASRHARSHYNIISRFSDASSTFPPPIPATVSQTPPTLPATNNTGIDTVNGMVNSPPPPAPGKSPRDTQDKDAAPAYICSLQEFNTVVDQANKSNKALAGQVEYMNRAIATYPQTMMSQSSDGIPRDDESDSEQDSDNEYLLDSDDDSPQRAQSKSKSKSKYDGRCKKKAGLVLSDDDDDFLDDSDDDNELFKNFTAPSVGGRYDGSPHKPTPKSRIRGIQDLIQNKEKGASSTMNMIKPGQSIRVRANGKGKKKQ